ncbi:MAG: outer membrane protein assembly factor BamD, partial [Gemmatimonadota bacterium]
CKGGTATDPILRLSAQEALDQGKALMTDEKYFRAREFLTHAYEVEPNSLAGREALLLTADSFYQDGGNTNFIQAEARYRDFLNRFPTSDRAAYAQFQIANSLAQRMRRPDRDLTATEDALSAYQDLIRLYPTSEYAAQARDKIHLVKENLADHELVVGEFYLQYRLASAAVKRFEFLLENYPAYTAKDKALLDLGVAYVRTRQPEKARETYERLAREFPDSEYLDEFPKIPEPATDATADDGATRTASDGTPPSDEATGEDPPPDGAAHQGGGGR